MQDIEDAPDEPESDPGEVIAFAVDPDVAAAQMQHTIDMDVLDRFTEMLGIMTQDRRVGTGNGLSDETAAVIECALRAGARRAKRAFENDLPRLDDIGFDLRAETPSD